MSKIKKFQIFLKKNNIDYFLLNRTDEFLSEYIASYAERLKWLTEFSGSAGRAIISQKKLYLFVDGRYTVQAQEQVDQKNISLKHLDSYWNCVKEISNKKITIAIHDKIHSIQEISKIKTILRGTGSKLFFLNNNPIDELWLNQPEPPKSLIFNHPNKYAGIDREYKIKKFQLILKKNKINYYVLCSLDSIAWLLNIRANDINHTPLVLSNLLIPDKGKLIFFCSKEKIKNSLKKKIKPFCELKSFKDIEESIKKISSEKSLCMDYHNTSIYFKNLSEKFGIETSHFENPCINEKAIKNNIELKGARKANIRDGVSIVKFLFWLKNSNKINKITEIKAADFLYNIRKKNKLFHSLSFDTISAVGKHAALPHYRVTKKTNSKLKRNEIYLLDSGAQYKDGTTDITRTVILGKSSEEKKDRFTRVLKGHIAIASHIFPKGTTGSDIDFLARKSLKEIGCDYDHGTGHGIGSFLSVHEGPQRIAKKNNIKSAELKSGMIISNEPGYYEENKYGIRIENLIIVKEKSSKFLEFETISFAPIDIDLIDKKILSTKEIDWINSYHLNVYKKLKPFLVSKERLWLKKITKPL